jgi:hypothetical protein
MVVFWGMDGGQVPLKIIRYGGCLSQGQISRNLNCGRCHTTNHNWLVLLISDPTTQQDFLNLPTSHHLSHCIRYCIHCIHFPAPPPSLSLSFKAATLFVKVSDSLCNRLTRRTVRTDSVRKKPPQHLLALSPLAFSLHLISFRPLSLALVLRPLALSDNPAVERDLGLAHRFSLPDSLPGPQLASVLNPSFNLDNLSFPRLVRFHFGTQKRLHSTLTSHISHSTDPRQHSRPQWSPWPSSRPCRSPRSPRPRLSSTGGTLPTLRPTPTV